MLWSELRLILKTSSVTPDFFYVFYRILSFSTVSQSFKKICVWEVFKLGANVLKLCINSKDHVFKHADTPVEDVHKRLTPLMYDVSVIFIVTNLSVYCTLTTFSVIRLSPPKPISLTSVYKLLGTRCFWKR